jgi:hypothetical protein
MKIDFVELKFLLILSKKGICQKGILSYTPKITVHYASLHSHATLHHIFASPGNLRFPYIGLQKRHIQPERYTQLPLKLVENYVKWLYPALGVAFRYVEAKSKSSDLPQSRSFAFNPT